MTEPTWVKRLNRLQAELGEQITTEIPTNDGQWEALEKMTTAHKTLRSIDRTPLSQQKLPL